MAPVAYNLRHWMNKFPKKKLHSFVSLLFYFRNMLENQIIGYEKTYGLPCPFSRLLKIEGFGNVDYVLSSFI